MVKSRILGEIGREINDIRTHPNFPPYFDTLVKKQGNDLWKIVKPLMHGKTNQDWDDLRLLMHEAYNLAGDMSCGPYEWRFNFVPVGANYHPGMVNKDPFTDGPPLELAQRRLKVRLGITPAVHLRDNTGGEVKTAELTAPMVLLKG
jgi:hypothetical protein